MNPEDGSAPVDGPAATAAADAARDWERLLEAYGRFLHGALVRLCPPRMGLELDDLEQEARLRLWRALRERRKIGAAYIYRVAASTTVDAIRRAKARRHQLTSVPYHDDSPAQAEAALDAPRNRARTPEESMGDRRALGHVGAALETLERKRRRAVGLYLQGFTTAEIGELLGWSEPKARNLAYRGLRQLRDRLVRLGVAPEGG